VEPHRQHYNITLAILTFAGSAFSLTQTMVVPALPVLKEDLNASTTWVTWVLTSFLLVAAVATPVVGKLGDQYGKERLLLIVLVFFLVGQIGAALSWNIWALIVFRGVQGVAGAIFPLAFGIIRDEFPPEKVATGIGLISAVFGIGGGIGIALSGVIVDNVSWRWLFIIPAFGVAIAIVLVKRFIPESPIRTASRIDVPGIVLLTIGLISLLLALTEGENWGWGSTRIVGLFAISAIALVTWVFVERRVDDPLVDMKIFAERPVLLTNIIAVLAGFAMLNTFVLIPTFAETPNGLTRATARVVDYGFGASATKAGLIMLPMSVVLLFAGPIAGQFGRRVGMKWPLGIGMLLIACVCGALATWNEHPWQFLVTLPFFGIAFGFSYAAMAAIITQAVPPTETGVATGMNTVMRTIGSQIGAQLGAAILAAHLIAGTSVPSEQGYQVAFLVCGVAGLVGAALAIFVTPPRRLVRLRRRQRALATAAGGRD
jgi:EmrB/QacA subfamily drug resistance transporter